MWVRDSTAGIGTVTFYNPENGLFGGLGHGICDVDTNSLMPMKNGDIVPVTISGVEMPAGAGVCDDKGSVCFDSQCQHREEKPDGHCNHCPR